MSMGSKKRRANGDPGARPLRADAQRNRERVLEIARELFEERGSGVEMDDVADRAGVGVGTIYRHFPTKDALIQAVLASHVQRLADGARARLGARDAGGAFFGYLEILAREFVARGTLHEAAARAGAVPDGSSPERDAFRASLAALLERAQRAGAIRSDVTADEVIFLVRGALFPGEGVSVRARRRMFGVVRDGLRRS
jgi:AcrR family transcriptional regulator